MKKRIVALLLLIVLLVPAAVSSAAAVLISPVPLLRRALYAGIALICARISSAVTRAKAAKADAFAAFSPRGILTRCSFQTV